MEQTDEDLLRADEIDRVFELFKDAKFNVSYDEDQLEHEISLASEICIIQTRKCYCYTGLYNERKPKRNKYFIIKCERMTVKNVIFELIKQKLNPNCNHGFLEGIEISNRSYKGMHTFDLFWGS
tara:strand:- start:202 stop:573 length:372 start_codon:yes stop_codon:yes gene_type:complete